MHAPSSTSNPLTFLETGSLPVENEIHIKQLCFLHHIINLHDDDPVKTTYLEQLKYPYEQNWGNEIIQLKLKYDIGFTDEQVKHLSKERWKSFIKNKVKTFVWNDLTAKALLQKHGQRTSLPSKLKKQDYLTTLPSTNARKIFHIRTGTIDLKGHRKYKYGDNTSCRLCDSEMEDVDHVINTCPAVPRGEMLSILTMDCDELLEISKRCILFDTLVDEAENLEPNKL